MGPRKDDNLEPINLETKKKSQKIDRVVLDSESITSIQPILDQIKNVLGDMVQISQKDVVNFLIQERLVLLTEAELNKIKSKHFDLVRALKRATMEVIKAKQNGSDIELNDVLKIIQTPSVNQSSSPKKTRGRKPKVSAHPSSNLQLDLNGAEATARKSSNSDQIENAKSDSKIENSPTFSNQKSS